MPAQIPAVEGWFTLGDEPRLLGGRCTTCSTVVFPPREAHCPNPECEGTELQIVPLSNRGTIWSYTNACYQPPAPYIATTDPFEPFCLAAVELAAEQLVILGQVVEGVTVEDLKVGQEVELTLGTLFSDDDGERIVWRWQPVQSDATVPAPQ